MGYLISSEAAVAVDKLKQYGKCNGEPPSFFFPQLKSGLKNRLGRKPNIPSEESRTVDDEQRKRAVFCTGCTVKEDCLEYALYHEMYGVWGGTTELDRRQIRKNRGINISIVQASA